MIFSYNASVPHRRSLNIIVACEAIELLLCTQVPQYMAEQLVDYVQCLRFSSCTQLFNNFPLLQRVKTGFVMSQTTMEVNSCQPFCGTPSLGSLCECQSRGGRQPRSKPPFLDCNGLVWRAFSSHSVGGPNRYMYTFCHRGLCLQLCHLGMFSCLVDNEFSRPVFSYYVHQWLPILYCTCPVGLHTSSCLYLSYTSIYRVHLQFHKSLNGQHRNIPTLHVIQYVDIFLQFL